MPLPVVAIVGRPNVGKSSIFNRLAARRIAIVDPTAGVTRDRVATAVELGGRWVELVDTGGMGIEDTDRLTDEVERQITTAIDEAAVIVMVVDLREGVLPLDEHVADRLRRQETPVVLVANKADEEGLDPQTGPFFALGLGEPTVFSAQQNRGRDELVRHIVDRLPQAESDEVAPAAADMKIAIVGKRNAGKSTLINSLAREQRVIVSEVPGTTRDSIDIRIEKDGLVYTVIDTAGLRRKRRESGDIEFYSRVRAERAIRDADVVILLIDAMVPISTVDKHLGRYILDERRPVVIAVNKWDLAKELAEPAEFDEYLARELPGLGYAPISVLSALQGRNTERTLDVARALYKQAHTRVSTADVNRAIDEAVRRRKPPAGKTGAPVKLKYGTQIAVDPPTFVLFVNDPQNVSPNYARYLVNRFRELLPFDEVPVRLLFRRSGGERKPPETKPRRKRGKRRDPHGR